MVVLSWLRTPAHLLKVFVANRVVNILDRTLPSQWFHVPTADNPADIASRGCIPSQLVNHKLWWSGPDFLRQDFSLWPSQDVASVPDLPDLKEVGPSLIGHVTGGDDGVVLLLERFSSLVRAKRVIAWMLRFKKNTSLPKEQRNFQ
ncbi:uncharacterized protein LOC123304829 [Chrysoperla carnea]|uniref:uncharacterized protein LOC123304829 n=1 Tax=Chrysoperla carnea TaxID=189513 RepID=UPI001D064D4A|nr:uncharacterized protein LOC123304829 [Chrysoperla carnea]